MRRGKALTGDKDVPLFSMAWIRLTRARGAVSGGVNCSLRSGIETAETTTQITVTLLEQSTPPHPPTQRPQKSTGTVNKKQLETPSMTNLSMHKIHQQHRKTP